MLSNVQEIRQRDFGNQTKRFFLTDGSDILIRAVRFVRYMYVLVLLHVCNETIAYINREKVVDASRRTIYKDFSSTPWQKCKLKIGR